MWNALDHCIQIILELGPNALIAKADLKDAFRIIPIHPQDYRLLGFVWEGSYYYDKCLPMGCSISCQIFESLSSSIQWILTQKLAVSLMSHILDDFIFFGPPSSPICQRSLKTFMVLAQSLNLPVKAEKTVLPSTQVELHGILVNTETMELVLPLDKLQRAVDQINHMMSCKKIELVKLQSLIGLLNFACRAIVPGRAFLRRLIWLTKGIYRKHHHVRLTNEARRDLKVWYQFLEPSNCVGFVRHTQAVLRCVRIRVRGYFWEWLASDTVPFSLADLKYCNQRTAPYSPCSTAVVCPVKKSPHLILYRQWSSGACHKQYHI